MHTACQCVMLNVLQQTRQRPYILWPFFHLACAIMHDYDGECSTIIDNGRLQRFVRCVNVLNASEALLKILSLYAKLLVLMQVRTSIKHAVGLVLHAPDQLCAALHQTKISALIRCH